MLTSLRTRSNITLLQFFPRSVLSVFLLKLLIVAGVFFLWFNLQHSAGLSQAGYEETFHAYSSLFFFSSPGIPTSSQPAMTVTGQRRQPPVVPLTLTSDLHLQQSPQQLSPTLSSPVNITQVRLCSPRLT